MSYVDIEELIKSKQIEAVNKLTETEIINRKLGRETDKAAEKHIQKLVRALEKARINDPVERYINNPFRHMKWMDLYGRNFNSVVADKVAQYFKQTGMVVEEHEGMFLLGRQKIVLRFPKVDKAGLARQEDRRDYGGPEPDWHQEARDCSNVVEAVRLVRHNTGWSLSKARGWVDEHCGRLKAEQRYVRIQSLEDEVERLKRENRHLRGQYTGED